MFIPDSDTKYNYILYFAVDMLHGIEKKAISTNFLHICSIYLVMPAHLPQYMAFLFFCSI